jgi:hypothetical protein
VREWSKPGAPECPADDDCVLVPGHDGECFDGQCLYRHPGTGKRCLVSRALATDEHWNGAGTDHEFVVRDP